MKKYQKTVTDGGPMTSAGLLSKVRAFSMLDSEEKLWLFAHAATLQRDTLLMGLIVVFKIWCRPDNPHNECLKGLWLADVFQNLLLVYK